MSVIKLGMGAIVALGTLGAVAPAQAQEYQMRVAITAASTSFICRDLLSAWAGWIEEESGGRIDTELFCDATLGQVGDTVNRVAAGVAEAGWDLPNVYGARFANYGVVGVPGIIEDAPAAAAALWSLYGDGTFPPIDGLRLATVQLQNTVMFWTRAPLADPTNLDGTKIISGSSLRGATTVAMGGVPMSLRIPEYYQALARGAADGLMTNMAAVSDYRFYEQAPYAYAAPWGAGFTFSFINEAWYNSLPADLQAVIDNNSGEAGSRRLTQMFLDYEAAQREAMSADNRATITVLSDEQLEVLAPVFETVAEQWVSSTENGQAYLEAFVQAYEARVGQ